MPTFYLVVDEIVPVNKFRFRVRMWRQAGFPPSFSARSRAIRRPTSTAASSGTSCSEASWATPFRSLCSLS